MFGKYRLFRSLTFWIVTPVLLIGVMLGYLLQTTVLTVVSDFAQNQIKQNIREIAREVYSICDQRLNELIATGRGADRRWERVQTGLAIGGIEDYARTNGIGIIIVEQASQELFLDANLPVPARELLHKKVPELEVATHRIQGKTYYHYRFPFAPWDWSLHIVKDGAEYTSLLRDVRRTHYMTGIILIIAVIVLMVVLQTIVNVPVRKIIGAIRSGHYPDYKGINQFEYLSEGIRDMKSALEEKTEWFNSLVATAPVLIVVLDEDNRIQLVNRSCEEMTGLDSKDLQGRVFWSALVSEEKAAQFEGTVPGIVGRIGGDFLLPMDSGKGNKLQILWRGTVINDTKHQRKWSLLTGLDFTDRIEAEQSIRDAEQRYRSIFENAVEGIYQSSLKGRFLDANPAMAEILGYSSPEELVGEVESEREQVYRDPQDWDWLMETLREKNFLTGYIVQLKRKDGRIIWCSISATAVRNESGAIEYIEGIMEDITERIKAEAEIRKLNEDLERRVAQRTRELENAVRELEAFSYSVSHDLRAPLRNIDGFSQALMEDFGGKIDAEGKDYLNRIRRASQHMGQIIDDLINLSLVSRNSMKREPIELSGMAHEIVKSLQETEPGRNVDVSIQNGLTVQGDPGLLRVMLSNLLANAWKFTRNRSMARIEFGCKESEGERVFFVSDNGAGYDAKYKDKLFTAFNRLHTPEEFEGTGIGLAIVDRVVKRHHGRVWSESEVGEGAVFYFTLGNDRGG